MDVQDPRFSMYDCVEWSDVKDDVTTSVKDAIRSASNHVRDAFFEGLGRIRSKINRYEQVQVYWWHYPFIYVEVRDGRWKHYPCYMRMLVSFDVKIGKFASLTSANQYAFARRGWGALLDRLVGRPMRRYCDCATPDKADRCSYRALAL